MYMDVLRRNEVEGSEHNPSNFHFLFAVSLYLF